MLSNEDLAESDILGVLRGCQKIWTKLRNRVKAVNAKHVNKQDLLREISEHVHAYLDDDRKIIQFKLGEDSTAALDALMRSLLGYTRGRTESARYLNNISKAVKVFGQLETLAFDRRFETSIGVQAPSAITEEPSIPQKRVFVVHGHNASLKEGVARFLEQLHLEPIILHEQVNRGKTIIEKVEAYSDVDFAVVLLTDDDVGASRPQSSNLRSRARQNVIFEWGYLIAKLGRENVCALRSEGVEMPSDLQGVVYTDVDPRAGWKTELAKELRAAGFEVDLNRMMR